jgi:hypothetical protein
VLKLKEYGKYVIGVGIQESSSDILVQNCDEYYSYTSLTGLTKTTDLGQGARDPWILVKDSISRMVSRGDVMRSDRLKQVMQELDPNFDEGAIGFSKFSKFLVEASSRGLLRLTKLDNGQYEVGAGKGRGRKSEDGDEVRGRRDRKPRGRRERREADEAQPEVSTSASAAAEEQPQPTPSNGVQAAPKERLREGYAALTGALEELKRSGRDAVRDSDLKRKILETSPDFDEGELGFAKFSKFLAQAADDGVISLGSSESGGSDVSLPNGAGAAARGREAAEAPRGSGTEAASREQVATAAAAQEAAQVALAGHERAESREAAPEERAPEASSAPAAGPTVIDVLPPEAPAKELRLGPRRGSTRRRGDDDVPPLFAGQVAAAPGAPSRGGRAADDGAAQSEGAAATGRTGTAMRGAPEQGVEAKPSEREGGRAEPAAEGHEQESGRAGLAERPEQEGGSSAAEAEHRDVDLGSLGLPSEPDAIVRYMAHRYKGVGAKTAETLVERFGSNLFETLHDDPEAIERAVPAKRAEQVLEAWRSDFERRTSAGGARGEGDRSGGRESRRGGRGRPRGRGRS